METFYIDQVEKYNRLFGRETKHPLVTVIDIENEPIFAADYRINYGVYTLFLKQTRCGDIMYGKQTYDYQEGTIVSFAPGQVTETHTTADTRVSVKGLLFHPDLIHGTTLGQEIKQYSFFSYDSREALHINEEEKATITDCLNKIQAEIDRSGDKHSKRLITSNISLLLDYCMRFYDRQFTTRKEVNKNIIVKFERLLDEYFDSDAPAKEGLPTVRYFADKVFLSPNYFGDMISKQTGKTASEYIQNKLIDRAKESLLVSDKTMTEIAYDLGFQYPQHLSRMFKRVTGVTPNQFRMHN